MKQRRERIESIIRNFHAIKRSFSDNNRSATDRSGVNMAQASILMVLMSKGSLSMSELASTLCVSPSATTQLLDGLVERDFVKREPDEVDRRIVRVTVSAKGKQYLSQTRGKGVDRFMSMFDVLNDSELEQIESITQKLTHVKSGTSK